MREILFRGKNCFGEWVEGFYYQAKIYRNDSKLCDYITIPHPKEEGVPSDHHVVDLETVGQYTGLTDKNGKKIFEGDIVKSYNAAGKMDGIGVVHWSDLFASWHIAENRGMYSGCIAFYEVIGNIHDNPDLLEVNE